MRHVTSQSPRSRQRGVTLIEMVVAIVVTGILLALVGMFTRNQITGYFDVAARAELADTADTALRRIARDLQAALPNSVRVDASNSFLEFIPIRDGGRYRADLPGDFLDFSTADTSFEVFGPPVTVNAGNSLVVYNLGIPGASAYEIAPLTNRRLATAGGASVTFTAVAGVPLPFSSPSNRFQIVDTPVSYVCAAGSLLRYTGYGFPSPATLTATSAFGATVPAVLATNVSGCTFSYAPGVLQRNGLVSIRLTLTHPTTLESVTLYHQVDVVNTP